MQNQLVGLLAGGLAIVAGDIHFHVGGQEPAPRFIDPRQGGVRDVGRVHARPLGDGDGDGLLATLAPRGVGHVVDGLSWRLDDCSHVTEVDRSAAVGNDNVAGVAYGADRGTDRDLENLIGRGELTGLKPDVGGAERLNHFAGCHAARRQAGGVESNAELRWLTANEVDASHVGNRG